MISLDDQFKYDFTELNILISIVFIICFCIALLINYLEKKENQLEQQEQALDFLVRQAEQYDLYELEKKQNKKGNKNV